MNSLEFSIFYINCLWSRRSSHFQTSNESRQRECNQTNEPKIYTFSIIYWEMIQLYTSWVAKVCESLLSVCLGLLSCWMTHFLLRFISQTGVLTFFFICWYNSEFIIPSMMASRPGSDAVKQAQTMILPPPCFTDELRFLCWNAVFFYPNIVLII